MAPEGTPLQRPSDHLGAADGCGIGAGLVEFAREFGIELRSAALSNSGADRDWSRCDGAVTLGCGSSQARATRLASRREISDWSSASRFENRAHSDISSPSSLSRSWPNRLRTVLARKEIRWPVKSKESRRCFRAGKGGARSASNSARSL